MNHLYVGFENLYLGYCNQSQFEWHISLHLYFLFAVLSMQYIVWLSSIGMSTRLYVQF